jgi:FKBP-type peptidyl-prolyl cis-trans isomerase SlyD
MAKIKRKDFLELDFTGTIKETKEVFDTTDKRVAEKNGMDPKAKYQPAIICVGQKQIFPRIEQTLIGKEAGRTYTIELSSEESFKKKDAKLLKMISGSVFRKNKIKPMVGLGVTIDDHYGIIRTVSGGRCMVDFNHPLAGKELIYEVKVNKIIKDKKEQIKSLIEMDLKVKEFEVTEEESGKFSVKFDKKINDILTSEMNKKIVERVKEVTMETIKIN